jgi:hypothetical protein
VHLRLACGDHKFPLLGYEATIDDIAAMNFAGFDLALFGNRSHVRPEHIRGVSDAASYLCGGFTRY